MSAGDRRISALVAAACLAVTLAACSPLSLAIGAGATAGVAIAEERSVGEAIEDAGIVVEINRAWIAEDANLLSRFNTAVHQGHVLVTGTAASPEQMLQALRLVWQVDGVREVINEIRVGDDGGAFDAAQDAWIASQLRARLTFDNTVQSINYIVEVARGVVYLMGIARDEDELERVKAHARQIEYVRGIVSHVRFRSDGATQS